MIDKKKITEVTGQQRKEVLDLFEPMTAQLGDRSELIVEKIPGDKIDPDADPGNAVDGFTCVRGDGYRVRPKVPTGEHGIYEVSAGTWNEGEELKSQLEEARERLQEALGELEQVEAICERHGYDNDNGPPVAEWLDRHLKGERIEPLFHELDKPVKPSTGGPPCEPPYPPGTRYGVAKRGNLK